MLITISVDLMVESENGKDCFVIVTNEESEKILQQALCVQGDSLDDCEKKFWEQFQVINEYNKKRSNELDKWKPFQKGDWKHIGGSWFIIFGINAYFRKGKGMKGGWYIPFTKMNISINNYWRNHE